MHGEEQGAVLGAVLQHPSTRDERLSRQLAKARIPVRGVNLQRMMKGVAAEQRALPPILQLEDDMARRVAGGGLDQHRVVDRVRAVEQHRLAGLDHRQHAVAIGAAALRVGVRRGVATRIAVFVLGTGEQILGVRKGRDPAAVTQHRVPADVIGVQMGAEHDVDVFRRGAGLTQAREIRRVALVEARQPRPLLVIATAAVEQDRVAIGADEPGVHAGDQPIVLGRVVMRYQPRQMPLQQLALEASEILLGREAGEPDLLLHARDAHRADGPGRHSRRLLVPRTDACARVRRQPICRILGERRIGRQR